MSLFKRTRKVRKYIPRRLDTAPDVNSLRISATPFEEGSITVEDFECMVRHLANARDIMARARKAAIGNKAYLNWHRQIQKVEDTLAVARYQRDAIQVAALEPARTIFQSRVGHGQYIEPAEASHRHPHEPVDPDPASGE